MNFLLMLTDQSRSLRLWVHYYTRGLALLVNHEHNSIRRKLQVNYVSEEAFPFKQGKKVFAKRLGS